MNDPGLYYNEAEGKYGIKLKGEIDIYTAPEFKNRLNAAMENSTGTLYLDCSDLRYMDSTGLGVLIGALKSMKEQGRNIHITNLKPNVYKLFKITGLDKIFVLEE